MCFCDACTQAAAGGDFGSLEAPRLGAALGATGGAVMGDEPITREMVGAQIAALRINQRQV